MHHARLARAGSARELGRAGAVSEHERGGTQGAAYRPRPGVAAGGGVEHVAPMHRDHQRRGCAGNGGLHATRGVACGHRVVGVDEVE